MKRRHLASRVSRALNRIFRGESGAGVLLMVVAAAALICANSPLAEGYHTVFHAELRWSPIAKLATIQLWIDDGLMALFFFVVGLEIKREVLDGDLSNVARRRLPVIAAVGGMALPAVIYGFMVRHDPALWRGWAIPAATDIAFAVGVIGLLGKRVPRNLRLLLLTIAIVDDLGAVAIIALAFNHGIELPWLAAAAGVLGAMVALNRTNNHPAPAYAVLAVALWYCVLHSGVHPTIAGILAAFAIPLKLDRRGSSLLLRMEDALVPWSGYLIVPLFGFANAGVALGWPKGTGSALPLAVIAGLVLGKQGGIMGSIALAEWLGFAKRPRGVSWLQLWGMALLCGIGFTMSLFIAGLAFPASPELADAAKLGILGGSLIAALAGYTVLRMAAKIE